MTTPTGKKSSGELAKPIAQKRLPAAPPFAKLKPNKMTLGIRPHKYVEPTRAEMYEDLRKAVENTDPRRSRAGDTE